MNKKEIDRVIRNLELLNKELDKTKQDKNYKPHYPCNIEDEEEEEDQYDRK